MSRSLANSTAADDLPFVPPRWRWLRKNPTLILGALLLLVITVITLAAPWIATHDPQDIDPLTRMQGASTAHYFGTDALGRDVFSRAVWGGRISMIVGLSVAVLSTLIGVLLGLVAGFVRWADGAVMRVGRGSSKMICLNALSLRVTLITNKILWK